MDIDPRGQLAFDGVVDGAGVPVFGWVALAGLPDDAAPVDLGQRVYKVEDIK